MGVLVLAWSWPLIFWGVSGGGSMPCKVGERGWGRVGREEGESSGRRNGKGKRSERHADARGESESEGRGEEQRAARRGRREEGI